MKAFAEIEAKDTSSKSSSLSSHLKGRVHRNSEARPVPPIVHEVLRSPGQPLDTETRGFFEPRFGYDFSNIPVRSQSEAGEDRSGDATNRLCSLPTVSPRACPFGGACHTCPVRVQPKLKIGQPDDEYEREADRVAEEVMRMPEPSLMKEEASAASHNVSLQRKCSGCTDDEEMLQRRRSQGEEAGPGAILNAPPIVDEILSTPGQALALESRMFMERRFGRDFSHVRIHSDNRALESLNAVHAVAYTVGAHIVADQSISTGRTATNLSLLAHELTHVVQQSNDLRTGGRNTEGSSPSADAVAAQVFGSSEQTLSVHQRARTLQRAVSTLCLPPSSLFGSLAVVNPVVAASVFGELAETLIQLNYCRVMGCSPMQTDYFDNPIPASYIAFLVARNPRLDNPRDIAALALMGITGLNRPDILTDRQNRKEYYEIKPRSLAGIAAGETKLLTLQAFMAAYSLPYVFGTAYMPAPPNLVSATVMAGPWPVTFSIRAERVAPGLIVYEICLKGELAKITAGALLAALVAAILLLAPEASPVLIPLLASAQSLPAQKETTTDRETSKVAIA